MQQFLPILILIAVIAIVIARLPKVSLGHTSAFKMRRLMNWVPLGLTYAFLYMGRYNLTVSKNALGDLMSKADFGTIFFWGTLTYGCAFVINGPLTDKFGGRRAILIAAAGSAAMNLLMGLVVSTGFTQNLVVTFSILYSLNMYFQSFGAVAIVKVNAHWFHLKERGVFSGIFGILISLGVYFAFDWGRLIVESNPVQWVFWVPTIILAVFWLVDLFVVRNAPSEAGFHDFDTADGKLSHDGEKLTAWQVAKRMFSNPVIVTIALIEFCSGFLRNAIMHWYIIFAKQTEIMHTFVPQNWGLLLCCAGILGGVCAGVISDRVFNSRRGPMAAVLYGIMFCGALAMSFSLGSPMLGGLVIVSSMAVIGVHGMLSGTASMDFAGKANVGIAVGLIDGLVYLGTAFQAILYGWVLPKDAMSTDPTKWLMWPALMVPVSLIGFLLARRLWNATPDRKPKPTAPTSSDSGKIAMGGGAPEPA